MKNIYKNIMKFTACGAILALSVTSCTIEDVVDPNGPSLVGVLDGATKKQLDELLTGAIATSRFGIGVEVTASGTMARELYLFDADPRNTGNLLGKNGVALDNNSFYSTAQWNGNYRSIKNANILLGALENTSFITETEKNGYRGFAKTLQAYELIQILKSYGKARLDVSDPENLGSVVELDAALPAIITMLDEANTNLSNAGSDFIFELNEGFTGFNTPETFAQFNRAVKAVAAVYAKDGAAALTALDNSFFGLTEPLNLGPKHVFGLGGGNDIPNPVFKVLSESAQRPNNGDQIIVHNSWINDAETGDSRVSEKTAVRPDPSTQDGLTGTHETKLYETNVSPIDIIRNEELILVYAEASILATNLTDAVTALNVIRNSAGLPDYSGAVTSEALTAEMLKQRRYSLWAENHRMFDLRRYGLSNTLVVDRAGDKIYNVFPIPLSENE